RWTAMMAFVFGVILLSTDAGSSVRVDGPKSANTGTPCWYNTPMTLPISVMGDVITSSPGPMPAAQTAMCSAAVPEEQVITYLSGQKAWNRSMNAVVCGAFQ